MAHTVIVHTRPDGGVSVTTPAPALIMEFHLFGRATGTLQWSRQAFDVSTRATIAIPFTEAEVAAVAFVCDRDIPGGRQYETERRPERKTWMMTAPPDGLGWSEAAADAALDAEATIAQGSVTITDAAQHPTRRFRDCWRQTGASLPAVDMPLARVQRMNEMRVERNRRLLKNDAAYSMALKKKNVALQDALVTRAQKLRDLPVNEQATVEACTTPEDLAAWTPVWPPDPTG